MAALGRCLKRSGLAVTARDVDPPVPLQGSDTTSANTNAGNASSEDERVCSRRRDNPDLLRRRQRGIDL